MRFMVVISIFDIAAKLQKNKRLGKFFMIV